MVVGPSAPGCPGPRSGGGGRRGRYESCGDVEGQARNKRGELGHVFPIDPIVGPELASVAAAKVPVGRSPKDGAHVLVMGNVKVAPRARGIHALEAQPAHPESDARSL